MNKKGMTWQQLALAIIAIIVVVIIIILFRNSGQKGFGFAESKIDSLNDKDNDGVAGLYDKCPCDPSIGEEWPANIKTCSITTC